MRNKKNKDKGKTKDQRKSSAENFSTIKKKKKNLGNTKRPFKKRKLKFLKCIIF